MTEPRDMTDRETAVHIREWAKVTHDLFAWPTDACGYHQSIEFSSHRNINWKGGGHEQWVKFLMDYADLLESRNGPAKRWDHSLGRMVEIGPVDDQRFDPVPWRP